MLQIKHKYVGYSSVQFATNAKEDLFFYLSSQSSSFSHFKMHRQILPWKLTIMDSQAWGTTEIHTWFHSESLNEWDHLKHPGTDGGIILKQILQEIWCKGADCIHLSQNRDMCWVLRFHKMQEISGLVKELLAFQQGWPDPMDGFDLYLAAHTHIIIKQLPKCQPLILLFWCVMAATNRQTLLLYKGT